MDLQTLRRAVEASPASVVITGRDGLIQYVNPSFETVSGYASAEVLGRNPNVVSSGLQSPDFYADLWQTIVSGREWRGEFSNRRKSGELYWERASISAVLDPSGAITHFVAVKEDITAERAAREALRRNEERFDLAVRGATDGVWDWDLTSNHVFYSPRWKAMLGYEDDEVEASIEAFSRLVHPSDLPRAMGAVHAYLAGTSDRYEVHLRMRHKTGRYIDVLARAHAARDAAGKACRLVGTHADISELKRTEYLLASQTAGTEVLATATTLMETVTRFLAAVGGAGLWTVGCVWAVDPTADVLRCLALWHSADVPAGAWEAALRASPIARGDGAAGLAWSRSAPIWIENELLECPNGPGATLGLTSTVAVPLQLYGRIVGVIQFCARDVRAEDHRWLHMFGRLHALALQILERRRAA